MTEMLTSSDLTLRLGELIESRFEWQDREDPDLQVEPGSAAHRALVLGAAALLEGLGPMRLVRSCPDAPVDGALETARGSVEHGVDVARLVRSRSILVRSLHQGEAAIERWSMRRLAVARSPTRGRDIERYLRVCHKLAARRVPFRRAKAALGLLDLAREPSARRVADFVREVGESAAAAEVAWFHAEESQLREVLRIGWLKAAVHARHPRELEQAAWDACVTAVDTAELLLRHSASHCFAGSAGALIAWLVSDAPIRREHAASA